MRSYTLFVVTSSVILFLAPLVSNADTVTCAGGVASHSATAQEAASANPPGSIVAGVTQVCPNDARLGISNQSGQAKQYLRSIVCAGGQYGGTTPDGTVSGLDNKFAVCAAKFLQAMSSQIKGSVALLNGGSNSVCLREGYRTPQQQAIYYQQYLNGGGIACGKNGVANCEHPRSIAIDVNTSSDSGYQQMWAAAPQYGVNFYLKARDKVHFVPATTECSGGGTHPAGSDVLSPNNYDFPQYYSQQPQTPSSPLSNMLRNLLSPTPQQPPTTSQTTPTVTPTNTTGNTCTPQFSCVGNTIYFQSASCSQQVYQTCQYGCNNNVCSPAPSVASSTSITSLLPTPTSLDILTSIANTLSAPTSSSGNGNSPLSLSSGLFMVYQAQPLASNNQVSTSSAPTYNSITGNTFFGPSDTGGNTSIPAAPLIQLLQSVKIVLQNFLVLVQPFGGRIPAQTTYTE